MGSAALNKPPSPFITFVYCILLISFLFYIPHRIVAERVKNGASRVHGSPLGHAPNAVGQGSPPTQNHLDCGRSANSKACLPGTKNSRSTERGERGASMYDWVEGVTPGRH